MVARIAVAETQGAAPAQRNSTRFGDGVIICALLLVGIALPIALAVWFHVFDIPRNDDWAYRRVLWHFVQTRQFAFVGWGTMTLVGQVLWAWAFAGVLGMHTWVPGVAVVCASAIGLVAAYLVARSVLTRAWAGLCVLLTLLFPGLLLNTSSFLTDMPALSVDMGCLALGAAALQRQGRGRWYFLATSMVVGCFAFSIREFSLAAPIAVLVATTGQDRRHWRVYVATAICVLAICGVLYAWATRLPGVQPEVVAVPTVSSLRTSLEELGALYFTLSLALSPLLPMAMGRLWRRLSLPSVVLGLVVLALGAWLFSKGAVLAGNYLTQQGATGSAVLNGARPDLFPEPVWRSLEVIAIAAGVALALVVGTISHVVLRTILHGGAEGLVASFAVLNSAVLTVYGVFVRASLFDRYLWALTFASAVVVVANCLRVPESLALGTWHHAARTVTVWLIAAASVTVAAILVLVTAAVTVNADAYDGGAMASGRAGCQGGRPPVSG